MGRPTADSYLMGLLGALLGILVMLGFMSFLGLGPDRWAGAFANGVDVRPDPLDRTNSPESFGDLQQPCVWVRMRINPGHWQVDPIDNYEILNRYQTHNKHSYKTICIPVLPSVYPPNQVDELHYNAILESDISEGDKVLVIGAGSGADSWVVADKSKSTVYAIDINPMAVINTRVTAEIGDFDVKPIQGDFRSINLPEDFSDFDYVVWNMPFVEVGAYEEDYAERAYHDGDDGTVLESLLERLPTLLKPGGKAILLNYAYAQNWIKGPGVITKVAPRTKEITDTTFMLFVVPNPADPTEAVEEKASE